MTIHRGKNGSFGFSNNDDNVISSIHPGGSADQSDQIKEGDVIYSINDIVTLHGSDTYYILKTCGTTAALIINKSGEKNLDFMIR